jgi:hypothetical protein
MSMSDDFGHIEKIEAYLEDRLRGDELSQFLDQMNTDSQLRNNVENQRMAMHAVESAGAQDLKHELKSIHKDLYPKGGSASGNNLKYGLLVAGILSIGAIGFFIKTNDEKQTAIPVYSTKIEQDVADIENKTVDNHLKAPKEEKETSAADAIKETPKTIQKENEREEKATSNSELEEGEIIFNFEKDGIPEPELVLSDTIGMAYLFNGKHLRFYNIDQNRISGITYMELEESLYLVYDNNCFKLELNRSPQKFIQEKDKDIIRYLMME